MIRPFTDSIREPAHTLSDADLEDFEMCFKMWGELTIPAYVRQARYGMRAGQPNPNFLNANEFNKLVLQPFRDARFGPHTGPSCLGTNATAWRRKIYAHGWTPSSPCFRETFALPRRFAMRAC